MYILECTLSDDFYHTYLVSRYGGLYQEFEINGFNKDELVFDAKEEAEKMAKDVKSSRNVDSYFIRKINSLDEI